MSKRFYIGDKEDYDEGLEEWIDSKIRPPPTGQKCECDKDKHAHESEPDADDMVTIIDCPNPAESYLYVIKDGHVCYTYMCWRCVEEQASEDYLCDMDYPTTEAGYAVVPKHCT